MAVAKKPTYIEMELQWLEVKALEIKAYVDTHPLDKLEDRIGWREIKGGGRMPVVISKIEDQIKSLREMLLDYIKITDAIGKAREAEDKKGKSVRGDQELSPLEQGLLT